MIYQIKELVKIIYNLFKINKKVKLFHVKAHTNMKDFDSLGNEEADRLASESIGSNPDKIIIHKNIFECSILTKRM